MGTVKLIGRVSGAPCLHAEEGRPVTSFTVAVPNKDQDAAYSKRVVRHTVVAYDDTARRICAAIAGPCEVRVKGRSRTRSFRSKGWGMKSRHVVVEEFTITEAS